MKIRLTSAEENLIADCCGIQLQRRIEQDHERLDAIVLTIGPDGTFRWKRVHAVPDLLKTLHVPDAIVVADTADIELHLAWHEMSTDVAPNVTRKWLVQQLEADNIRHPGRGVSIGVLDGGVDPSHPDFQGANLKLHDATGKGARWGDRHMQAILGMILSQNPEAPGIARAATIHACRIFVDGRTRIEWILSGLDQLRKAGVEVFSMSFGGPSPSAVLREVFRTLAEEGRVLMAGAGNSGNTDGSRSTIGYPARYPSVYAVGAIDRNGRLAPFSSTGTRRGKKPDFINYGVRIATSGFYVDGERVADREVVVSGTSFSCPAAASCAALLIQQARERGEKGTPRELFEKAARHAVRNVASCPRH